MKFIAAAAAAGALLLPITAFAASPFDGTWKGASGPSITYKVEGNTITRSDSTGLTFNLKTDGSFSAVQGDPEGNSAISVKMVGANKMVEVARDAKGNEVGTLTSTVSKDGKTMHLVSVNAKTHKTKTYTAHKL
jgi:hypothetical protein